MPKNSPVEYDADEADFAEAFLSPGGRVGGPMGVLGSETSDDEPEDVEEEETEDLEDPEVDSEDADDEEVDSKLTREQAIKLLAKVRKEAASKRVLTREQQKQIDEYQKWKDSQKTEVQRLKEENKALKAAQQQADFEKAQRKAARAAKLPVEFADRLRGSTPEELAEDAKRLAAAVGTKAPTTRESASGLFAGQRGEPVGARVADDEQDWFMSVWNDAK